MAKKTYKVEDENGNTWVVFSGDPAYPLVTSLKHPTPVLPQSVLMTGSLEGVDYGKFERIVTALTRWVSHGDIDDDDGQLLTRAVSLSTCLDQLRILKETT